MSYSEDELKKLGWADLALLLDMTTKQKQMLGSILLLAQQGNALAACHARALLRHGRDFVFWLQEAREATCFDEPNPGLMLARARDSCDASFSRFHDLLVKQGVAPFAP